MDKRQLAASFTIALIFILFTPCQQNKEEYGVGFMFKYEPHYQARRDAEAALVDHIKSLINHYKKEEAGGIMFIKDPLKTNSFQEKFSGMTMKFEDTKLYGLSRFKVEKLSADLAEMKVNMRLTMDELVVQGRYSLAAWVSTARGGFNMSIENAELIIDTDLMLDELGFLQVQKIEMDFTYGDLKTYFEKLGFLGKVFQGIVNKVGVFVLETMKPTLWIEMESKFRDIISTEARDIPVQFPNSINPVDKTLSHVRKLIKERNLDPVPLSDYSTQNSKWSKFELYNGNLYGLSELRRSGPMLLGFDSNTIYITVHLGVENLRGTYQWAWTAMRGVLGRRSQLTFSLDYVNIEIRLQQKTNNSEDKIPIVDSVNVTLGPTQLTSNGVFGAVDYILEMIFNVVPNMFRQRIAEAAEYPLTKALEDELMKIDIESFIEEPHV